MSGNPFLDTLEEPGAASPAPAPAQTAAKGGNPFLETLDMGEQSGNVRGRVNMREAVTSNADEYAEARRLAAPSGLPADVAARNMEEMKRQAAMRQYDSILKYSPALAAKLQTPDFAKLSHDDTENLSQTEFLIGAQKSGQHSGGTIGGTPYKLGDLRATPAPVGFAAKVKTAFGRGLTSSLRAYDADAILESNEILQAAEAAERGDVDAVRRSRYGSMFSGVGSNPEALKITRAAAEARLAENVVEYMARTGEIKGITLGADFKKFTEAEGVGPTLSAFGEAPASVTTQLLAQSLGQLLPTAPMMVGGGLAGGVRGLMAGTGASSFATGYVNDVAGALDQMGVDLSDTNAVRKAASSPEFREKAQQAFIKNSVIGAVDASTAGVAGGVRLATGAGKNLAAQTGVQMAGGAGGEVAGSLASGQEVSFNAAFSEAIAETPGAAFDASVLSARKMAVKQDEAQAAEQDAKALQQLSELAKASKLRERDPQSFAQFVNAAAADGPVQDIYVDARIFSQAAGENVLRQIAAQSPAIAAQIDEAVKVGGDLVVPVGEYASTLAASDLNTALLPHLRTAPEANSMEEAKTFTQEEAGIFKKETAKILEQREFDSAIKQSGAVVENELLVQLKEANRFTEDVNTANAKLAATIYTVQAARLGITPEEMYVKYPLQIQAESVAGENVMDQSDKFETVYRGEMVGADQQGNYYTADREFARNFTQSGQDSEIKQARIRSSEVYTSSTLPSANSEAEVTAAIEQAKAKGFKAVRVSEGKGQPSSVFVFDKSVLRDDASLEQPALPSAANGPVTQLWETIAKRDDAFQTPTSAVQDLAEVLKDVVPELNAEVQLVELTVPKDGGVKPGYTISIDAPDGSRVVAATIFDAESQRPFIEIGNERLNLGTGVGKLYQAVTGWALNNDKTLRPDPRGLSTINELRRTEQMVASMLKYGESRMWEPDSTQFVGLLDANSYRAWTEQGKESSSLVAKLEALKQRYWGVVANAKADYTVTQARVNNMAIAGTLLAARRAEGEFENAVVDSKGDVRVKDETGSVQTLDARTGRNAAWISGSSDVGVGYSTRQRALLTAQALGWTPSKGVGALRSLGSDALQSFNSEGHPDSNPRAGVQYPGLARLASSPSLSNILYQPSQGGNRGQISFADDIKDRPSILTLLAGADLSTFFHELGHFQLEVLADIASQPDAPVEVAADLQHTKKWWVEKANHILQVLDADIVNAKQRGDVEKAEELQNGRDAIRERGDVVYLRDVAARWGTPAQRRGDSIERFAVVQLHEYFARGFESYLFEGRSPNPELNGIFARFRAWLLNVYKQIANLNVELTPDVRGVMDRLVATNEQIAEAEAARSYEPLFKSAEEAGMTGAEWKAYHDLALGATQEAVDHLQTRSLRDMQWLSNARSGILARLQKNAAGIRKGVEAEVTAEVRAQPVYAVQRFLRYGELPEADLSNEERKALDALAGQPTKLSLPVLKEMYGEEPAAPWRYLPVGKNGLAATDGLDPNVVAEMFGFTSGDHLVRAVLEAQPETTVIEGMTDQRMLERYGDLSSPEALERAANEAIHNEARAKFVATELRMLAKATGQKNILTKAAREFAATIIARKKLRDIKPAQFAAAEARSAKEATKAILAKKMVEAAVAKRNQLVNGFATKAAYDALDEIEKGVSYLKRVGESKTVDPEYREQIAALLDRFDLRKITAKEAERRKSLTQWIEAEREKGNEPVIDPELENEALRKPHASMTLEEFRGLVDSVKNIEHLGRLKHKLLTAKDEREFKERADEAAVSIEENAKRTVKPKLERNTWTDKMKDGVTEFFVMHRKFAAMIRELDGYKDGGVMWELFSRPANLSGAREAVMREQATVKLAELFKPLKSMKEKTFIPAINNSLSREGRIMVALNAGNEGNLQRMMDGDHWTPAQVRAVIDTLTKPEMDFVQSIWDFVGQYRSEIGAQQRRLTGVEPEWVEATEVVTRHGTYKGGYLPVKYDTTRSTRSLADEAAAGIMDQWRGARGRAKTRDSFTKARADKVVDRPIRKDLGVITQHVTEVTHRLAWQEYLVDAQRLLRAPAIDNAIREHYGHEVLEALRDTIEDIAAGEQPAQNAFERGVNYLRTGATIAGLGWRVTTSLLQPFGLTQSMVRIGPKHVARGMAEWLGDSVRMESTVNRIYEKSEMMRLRGKTMQREISEIQNLVENRSSVVKASYFYLIQKMQIVADVPTWLGQYHKAVEQGADEATAIAQADQAVLDAQGGGQLKDLAAIQRGGPLLKLFTNFYSFFSTTYNLTGEAVGRTDFKNPLSIGRLAVDMLLLYSVPAALGTLLKFALSGGEDGEEKLWRKLIADQLTYLFGTMVGLRELAGGIQTAAGLPGDYQGPASVRLFAEMAKIGKQAGQGEIDEALLKAMNNAGGILLHYPSGQINATADGLYSLANGKTENPGALLVGSNKR